MPVLHDPTAEPGAHFDTAAEPALHSFDWAELPERHRAEATLPLWQFPPRAVDPETHCCAGDPPVEHCELGAGLYEFPFVQLALVTVWA